MKTKYFANPGPVSLAMLIADDPNVSPESAEMFMKSLVSIVGREDALLMVQNARDHYHEISEILHTPRDPAECDPDALLEREWNRIMREARSQADAIWREFQAVEQAEFDCYDPLASFHRDVTVTKLNQLSARMDEIDAEARLDWMTLVREQKPHAKVHWVGDNCIVDGQEYFALAT